MPDELADLLMGATERAGLDEAPGKSGASLERVVIDGQAYVLKHLDLGRDWTMRASGCLRGARSTCGNGASWPACPAASTSRSWPRPRSGAAAPC